MKIVAYVAGGLLVVLILFSMIAAIGGTFMNPSHKIERTIHLNAPADSLFAVVNDYQNYAVWRPDLIRVEPLPPHDGNPVWREFDKQKSNWAYEAVEISPPNRLKVKIAEPDAPVEGSWTILIEPEGSGSSITVVEEGTVHNVIFRFIGRTFFSQSATIEAYLKALAVRFNQQVTFQ